MERSPLATGDARVPLGQRGDLTLSDTGPARLAWPLLETSPAATSRGVPSVAQSPEIGLGPIVGRPTPWNVGLAGKARFRNRKNHLEIISFWAGDASSGSLFASFERATPFVSAPMGGQWLGGSRGRGRCRCCGE